MPYFLHEGGAALASRYPVLDHKYVRFADTNNDYLRADLLVGDDTVRLFSVHLQTSGIAQLRRRFRKDYNRDCTRPSEYWASWNTTVVSVPGR